MISKYRKQFNEEFSEEKYQELVQKLEKNSGTTLGFRQSESPIFLTQKFRNQLQNACDSIVAQIKNISNTELQKAIPKHLWVPNDTEKPHFLAIDFGICKNQEGEIVPQLIELQAFPTLYAYQEEFEETVSEMFPFLKKLKNRMPKADYIQLLKEVIVGDEKPKNVILLEILPEEQKTKVDFYVTEKFLGIRTVCITKIKKQGKKLFYDRDGVNTEIKRIYNRVIFDELEQHPDLQLNFSFTEELDVEWITHPNWFFKISKYILPKLNHEFIPKSYFLPDFPSSEKLENFVLKPLFSFAGSGVNLYPTADIIAQIKDKENYILQRKVQYEPLFEDINGEFSKAEIRMLYLWEANASEPKCVGNLVRMTKAEMVNVNFNKKDAIWIGSSVAFFVDEDGNKLKNN